jgi:hypothetical protein
MLLSAVGFMLVAAANVTNPACARRVASKRARRARGPGRDAGDLFRRLRRDARAVDRRGRDRRPSALGARLHPLSGQAAARRRDPSTRPSRRATLLCLAAALLVAAAASRRSPEGQRRTSRPADRARPARSRARCILLGVQAAVTALLLAGLALFTRSFLRVLDVQPGFRATSVVAMDVYPAYPVTNADKVRRIEMIDRLSEKLKAIHGVERVGSVADLPLASDLADGPSCFGLQEPRLRTSMVRAAGGTVRAGHADYAAVTGEYFAMAIPLKRGRMFPPRHAGKRACRAGFRPWLASALGRDPQRIEFGNMDGDVTP